MEHDPLLRRLEPASLAVPSFAMVGAAYGRREDTLAVEVFSAFAARHLSWRQDVGPVAQLTSLLSSPDVAPSHVWVVPVSTREGAEEVGWDLDRTLRTEGVAWMVSRFLLRTDMAVGDLTAAPGLCRMRVVRGPTEVVDGIDKLVDGWWSELERWDRFRGAVLYREVEEMRSNLALEVDWMGPWADLAAIERAAEGSLEPAARRLSVQVWHFRVSAVHPGEHGDRTSVRAIAH